jgi:hypothetical protein
LIARDAALVARFDAAMENIYRDAKREVGYNATRFLVMVRELGGLHAAHRLQEARASVVVYPHLSRRMVECGA